MAYLCVSGGNRSGVESRGGGLECPPATSSLGQRILTPSPWGR